MQKIELKITPSYVVITIDEIIHIQVPYLKNFTLTSYKQGKNWYVLTISNGKGQELVETWYKDKNLWVEILKLWSENIY